MPKKPKIIPSIGEDFEDVFETLVSSDKKVEMMSRHEEFINYKQVLSIINYEDNKENENLKMFFEKKLNATKLSNSSYEFHYNDSKIKWIEIISNIEKLLSSKNEIVYLFCLTQDENMTIHLKKTTIHY